MQGLLERLAAKEPVTVDELKMLLQWRREYHAKVLVGVSCWPEFDYTVPSWEEA